MGKPTYEARAARNGRWWSIEVRQLRDVHSQARRLDRVESMAREAIAVALQAAGDSFDVVVQVDYTSLGALQPTVEEAVRAREAADKAQTRPSPRMRAPAAAIPRAGYP